MQLATNLLLLLLLVSVLRDVPPTQLVNGFVESGDAAWRFALRMVWLFSG